MNSPRKDPENSHPELDYAPRWARNQVQPILGHSAGLPVARRSQNELVSSDNRALSDRTWRPRGLEPERVPEPSAYGGPNLGSLALKMGMVCAIAAIVAGALVTLYSAKQTAPDRVQAKAPPPSIASNDGTLPSIRSVGTVPALLDDRSAVRGNSLPQAPPREIPITHQPPQLNAPVPAANQLSSNAQGAAGPAVNQPTPRVIAAIPAANETSPTGHAAAAPALQPGSPASAKAPVVLSDDEIITLIKRGKDLLKDGDFAAARLLFERAADAGSADAALALGSTYDPLVIKRLGAITVTPDVENARKWYQIAADRGSAAASLQLADLARAH